MTEMAILVHFDQGLSFRGRLTAMKRSIVIPTKLKMHARKETKAMYRLVLQGTLLQGTLFQNFRRAKLI